MPKASHQRWLILTSSTGSGHDMRAYALQAWALQAHEGELTVEVHHALEEGSRIGRFGVWLYNRIQAICPALHNLYWFVAELFGILNQRGIGINRRLLAGHFRRFRPHLVISMHDSLNRGYFAVAKRTLGADAVACVTYCGEWSTGFGFSRNWIAPEVDRLYVRREAVREALVAENRVPPERLAIFCNLLPPRAFGAAVTDREGYREEALGLRRDRFTVFLATGAWGADRHLQFLDALWPHWERIQVIVVCGRSEAALARVQAWSAAHPELPLFVEGFSTRMPALLQVSDCLLTRGGANTMAEALAFGCPVLFHAHRGIMPQERCTLRFLEAEGVGVRVYSPRDCAAAVARWLDDPASHAAVKARMAAARGTDHPTAWVEELWALGATREENGDA